MHSLKVLRLFALWIFLSSFFHSITIEEDLKKWQSFCYHSVICCLYSRDSDSLTLGNVFVGGPSFSVCYLLQVLNYTEFSLNYDEMKHYMLIIYDVAIVNMGSNTGLIDCKQCKFK